MTVTAINAVESTAELTEEGQREYTITYQVETNDVLDQASTVLVAVGLPTFGTTFSLGNSFDTGAFFKGRSASLRNISDTRKLWDVVCRFSTKPAEERQEEDNNDPLAKPVVWRGSFVEFARPAEEDKDGDAILNAAGEPFTDPPVEIEDAQLTIQAVKNYAALDLNLWADYAGATNSDVFLGLPARTVRAANIGWEQRYQGLASYFEVQFDFRVRFERFDKRVLNVGFNKLVAGNLIQLKDNNGLASAVPLLLTADGSDVTDAAGANYRTFRILKERPFAAFGLPSTIS